MSNFCETYDASSLQQLTKIVTGEDKELSVKKVFPVALTQSVYDGRTGMRLDSILSRNNCVWIPYAGSDSATRTSVGGDYRRQGLILTFRNLDGKVKAQRYVGESLEDSDWGADSNWEDVFLSPSDIGIVDSLDSDLSDKALSARQGKILDEKISALKSMDVRVVDSLPEKGSSGVIYLIKNDKPTSESNTYREYIWISDDGRYEELGTFGDTTGTYYPETFIFETEAGTTGEDESVTYKVTTDLDTIKSCIAAANARKGNQRIVVNTPDGRSCEFSLVYPRTDSLRASTSFGDTGYALSLSSTEDESTLIVRDGIIDLSDYYTKKETNTKLSGYALKESVTTELAKKVDKVDGKGLSTNDFTNEQKTLVQSAVQTYDCTWAFKLSSGSVVDTSKWDELDMAISSHKKLFYKLSTQVYDVLGSKDGSSDSYSETYLMCQIGFTQLVIRIHDKDDDPVLVRRITNMIDGSLSETSENPVQNKVIKAELDKKAVLPSGGTAGQVLKKTSSGTEWANDNSTTYSKATQSTDGLMSKEDKTKLDSLSEAPVTVLTQTEYDALTSKEENRIYFIKG